MSPGPATSAGSRARPGKPACESRCWVLAWARRGAWGQPGPEGRGQASCHLGPAAVQSWGHRIFTSPRRQAGLGLSGGPTQPLHARLFPLLHARPSLKGLAQALCPKLMRRPPRRAGGRIASLCDPPPPTRQPPPHCHCWSSGPACGNELLGNRPTPHQAPALALRRSWRALCTQGAPFVPSSHEFLQGASRITVPSWRGQGPVLASWNVAQLLVLGAAVICCWGLGSSRGGRAKGGLPAHPMLQPHARAWHQASWAPLPAP